MTLWQQEPFEYRPYRPEQNKTQPGLPPIGLMPKYVLTENHNKNERYNEVCGAITRYLEAKLQIPLEWIEEHNELLNSKCDACNGTGFVVKT